VCACKKERKRKKEKERREPILKSLVSPPNRTHSRATFHTRAACSRIIYTHYLYCVTRFPASQIISRRDRTGLRTLLKSPSEDERETTSERRRARDDERETAIPYERINVPLRVSLRACTLAREGGRERGPVVSDFVSLVLLPPPPAPPPPLLPFLPVLSFLLSPLAQTWPPPTPEYNPGETRSAELPKDLDPAIAIIPRDGDRKSSGHPEDAKPDSPSKECTATRTYGVIKRCVATSVKRLFAGTR
jgi:hypothetical protein